MCHYRHTKVLEMLEKNYRVHCAVSEVMVPEDFCIKSKVSSILTTNDFEKSRARTMDIDDFLKLLHCMNADGLHFA
ncbi:hypothetical protein CAPTEDRAFT_91306 [Capitella teleta]|uniref:Uncharacterized protein n=1 Tax=Capitella teleta TaxID=283909 RepID=R7UB74_CAPTE|nr:hypothetical protein CAPTEDRAFT_91306 [Capitella teleta]|eukprot:ELU03615.1 hypothetical protein CAPTEDRAFT_91306 [Capitella teleta]